MAERLAVLSEGRVVQVGTPEEVYRRPADAFVAAFVGETNLLPGTLTSAADGWGVAETAIGKVEGVLSGFEDAAAGRRCLVSIRPEDVAVPGGEANAFTGEVAERTFLGEVGQYVYRVGEVEVKALVVAPAAEGAEGVRNISFPPDRVIIFPAAPGGSGAAG